MEVIAKSLELYVTATGRVPFTAWLEALRDRAVRAHIKIRLDRVRMGNLGDCKPLGDGVYELRIHCGSGYRIYFGQQGRNIVLLLCGGEKRSQIRDIQQAKKYWDDHQQRGHHAKN